MSTHLRVLAATLLLSAVPGLVQAQVTSYAWVPSYNGKAFVIDNAALAPPVEVTVPGTPFGLAATPDGRYVWVATSSTTMPVFEVATRGLVDTVTLPYAAFTLTFTPDGSKAFVTSNGGNRLMIVDVATRTVIRTVNFGASVNPYAVASSPDGRTAYVTAVTSQKLYAVDVESGTFPTPADIGAACNGIAVSRDGATGFISCAANDRVLVQDLVSNTTIQPIAVGGFPYSVALSPDERWLYVANGATDSVSVIDVATRTVVKTVTVGDLPNNVAFTPDGRYALVNNQNAKTVTVLDVEGGHVVLPPDIPLAGASSILAFFNAGFITPAIIVPSGTPLTVAGDAGLAQQGFHQFVTFNGGTLRLAGEWTTSRHLSLLADGGTIDTNGFDAFISGDVINDGILTKIGAGTLTLSGDHKHASTTLAGGTLIVGGSHPMDLTIASGTLGGEGTMGEIVALTGDGVIAPAAGTNTTTGILRATRVYMSGDVSFVVDLTGPTAGVDCDRVEASDFAAINTSTLVISPSSALPIGSSCTILTNATGTFAGLAEGAMLIAGARVYRISYIGGDGNDVTLTAMTTAPTLTPIAPQTVPANTALPAVTFTVADAETEAGLLNVTASSSNQALVPNANLTLGGSGAARTIAAMPAAAARGETTITITVSDGVASASTDFTLTVTEASAYYLAEGATGSFFDTDILIANPNGSPAPVVITFLKEDGTTIVRNRTLPATSRATIHADEIEGLSGGAAFSTTVTSTNDLPLIVERTMWWDDRGYGAHTEKATTGAAPVWYFAEGAQGFFSTYFLLANPHDTENTVIARYFREGAGAIERTYTLGPQSRRTIDAGADAQLRDQAFGARFEFAQAGVAERAMYFGGDPLWNGGHASAGSTATATEWFLAEGATGSYFTTFVLLANPDTDHAANVTLTFLPASGLPVTKSYTIAAGARLTRNIAGEDPSLASAAVATRITSSHPIVVERAQYWGQPAWIEAHNSAGVLSAATRWGLAEGRVGGDDHAQTYILLANAGSDAATVTVTFLRESGMPVVRSFTVPATSRFNIGVLPDAAGSMAPELANESFGALIESTRPIVVERSLYTNAGGITWAAGTNATATRLP